MKTFHLPNPNRPFGFAGLSSHSPLITTQLGMYMYGLKLVELVFELGMRGYVADIHFSTGRELSFIQLCKIALLVQKRNPQTVHCLSGPSPARPRQSRTSKEGCPEKLRKIASNKLPVYDTSDFQSLGVGNDIKL